MVIILKSTTKILIWTTEILEINPESVGQIQFQKEGKYLKVSLFQRN